MSNQPKHKTLTGQFIGENLWLILLALFLWLVYLLQPILTPFLAAAVIAYICDPLVDRLSACGFKQYTLGRTLATLLVMTGITLAMISILLILIPLLQKQSLLIAERLPNLITETRQSIEPWLQQKFGISLNIDLTQLQSIITKNWKSTGDIVGSTLKIIGTEGLAFIGIIANLLLLPVVLFYLLRDWDNLISHIGELIPREWIGQAETVAHDIDRVVAEFLRGQLAVMAALCVFYSIGLWLVGLDMALSIGLIAGLLSFVPYLGFSLAFIMATLLALLQFTSLGQVVPVLLVFGLGQIVESFILTPNLVGDRIGLHPVIVILALMAGGQLFGFAGVLLALPVSAAIAVGLRYTKQRYLKSDTYLK
jgi:predicted PurR-regulated permease PerM